MQAVRFHGKEDVRVEDVEEPAPGPGEVKLRNAHSGICGSDLHVCFSPEASSLDGLTSHGGGMAEFTTGSRCARDGAPRCWSGV